MLDQDTARALLTIADETGARVAFVGDRHQLPAVGRGGVLDHAARVGAPDGRASTLETVHRFTDPDYAALSLRMRTGDDPGERLRRPAPPRSDRHPPLRGRTHRRPRRRRRRGRPGHRRHPRTGRRPQRRHPRPPPRHRRRPAAAGTITTAAANGSGSATGSPPAATTPTSASRTARPGPSPASARTAASSSTAAGATASSPAEYVAPVRRARLRHHRPRRPRRDRRRRPPRSSATPPAPPRRTSR